VGQREGTLYFKIEPSTWWRILLHGNKAYYYPWLSSFHAVGNNLLDGDVGGLSLSKLISLSHSPPHPYHNKVLFPSEEKKKAFLSEH
jgi:hypothetical protein